MMLMKGLENNYILKNNNMEEKIEFEKTIRKNGMTKRICIEKCENGYIISITKYGKEEYEEGEESDEPAEYINECKKYISKTNPLKKDDSEVMSLKDFLSES